MAFRCPSRESNGRGPCLITGCCGARHGTCPPTSTFSGVVSNIVQSEEIVPSRSRPVRPRLSPARAVARKLGLQYVTQDELTWRRARRGKGFVYVRDDGSIIRHAPTIRRLTSLAVPPAYEDVRFSPDDAAHLQAIGRDAAGRLQYRYHPAWQKVRETRKARRLLRLAEALPRIRRSLAQHLAGSEPNRELAFAAVIELIARSAIRPGNDQYTKQNRSHGATTLLKSHVSIDGDLLKLTFRAKGNKQVQKEVQAPRLTAAIMLLRALPGRRLFQYRDETGAVHPVKSSQVNQFLRDIADTKISLKDFRTLLASAAVLDTLSRMAPAPSARRRRAQVLQAVRATAEELANTPTICRKSYVHEAIVTAFEDGVLERLAAAVQGPRTQAKREQLLAHVIATMGTPDTSQV
jgi:DNA topoisomerase I